MLRAPHVQLLTQIADFRVVLSRELAPQMHTDYGSSDEVTDDDTFFSQTLEPLELRYIVDTSLVLLDDLF